LPCVYEVVLEGKREIPGDEMGERKGGRIFFCRRVLQLSGGGEIGRKVKTEKRKRGGKN